MRVLNVDITVDPVSGGGCAERTYQMSRALADRGIACDLLIQDIGLTPKRLSGLHNVNLHIMPCLMERFYVPRFPVGMVTDLIKRADIIHLMGHWEFPDAMIYPFLRHIGKPYVNCPAGSLKVQGRSQMFKALYNRIIGNRIVRDASRLIAISPNEYSQFHAYGVRQEKIILVPNGVNPDDYHHKDSRRFRKDYGIGPHPFFLFVGRLNPIKGPDLLIHAFSRIAAEIPDYHLVLAGPDDGMQGELEKLVWRLKLDDRVHFTGFLNSIEKSKALHAADFMVIPSRSEAMSIVVLEAGATATPVLASDQCGLNDIADSGGGRIVPASVAGLEAGLREMTGAEIDLKIMGKKLNRYVLDNYTWQSAAQKLETIYREVLSEIKRN